MLAALCDSEISGVPPSHIILLTVPASLSLHRHHSNPQTPTTGDPPHAQPAGHQQPAGQQRAVRRVSSQLHRRLQQHTAGDPLLIPLPAPGQPATRQLSHGRQRTSKRRTRRRPLSLQLITACLSTQPASYQLSVGSISRTMRRACGVGGGR